MTDLVDDITDEKPLGDDIQGIFIDESNFFDNENITDDDKKLIIDLIDGTDLASDRKIYNDSDGAKM